MPNQKKVNLYAMNGDSRYAAPAQKSTQGLITNPIQPEYGYTNVNITDPSMKKAYEKVTGYTNVSGNTASGYRPASEVEAIKYNGVRDLSHYGSKATSGGSNLGYSTIGYNTLSNISAFTPSQAYIDAMNYTQSLLDKINTGRTSYSDKVDAMMAKIEGRDKFSYDFNTDPLFQNMLGSAMASGQTAMQDTMGQAAALTGGYGSSYATSVGNQAYNNFVQEAYAQLPEYYKLALDAYTREGDEMYRQLGMYNDADDKEYGRLTNAYSLNYGKAQDMYNQEYSNYWDTANYNLNVDKYNNDTAMEAAKFNASAANSAARASASSSASGSGSGSGDANTGASDAQFNKALSLAEDVVNAYGFDSAQSDEALTRIFNMYGVSQAQAETIISQLRASWSSRQAQLIASKAKSAGTAANSVTAGKIKDYTK